MTSVETVRQVCLTVYQAIASVQQQHPEFLNEKYRSLPLQQPGHQATFTDRLSTRLSKLPDGQAVVAEVEATLRSLFTPDFFQTADFATLITEISQIMGLPSDSPPPPDSTASLPVPPDERPADAIALLLLDAENFQLDVATERFLAESCTCPLQVKIAFANWRSLGKKDLEFHNRHYDLMHVPGGKDMADGKMIAIGSSIHEHYPLAKEILVCSSDQVMTSLCTKLRQRGLVVYQVRKEQDGSVTIFNSHTNETWRRPNSPAIPPLEICIAQLKELIRSEQQQSGQAWIPLSRISQLFHKQNEFTISQAVTTHSPGKKARDLFLDRPGDFAVHQPPDHQEIYISLFQVAGGAVPNPVVTRSEAQEQATPVANSPNTTKVNAAKPFKQATELEAALVQIVKEATVGVAEGFVDISIVGSHFHKRYQQPVTTVLKQLQVNKKFLNFLTSCKALKVQQKNKVWQVACR
ncbi:MAG: hypothetical protein ACP5RH_14320 [Leptodesmis sp.]|uniref:hypothetical protein n=1 Tax=Leptodesmis sp. TaxID=3100501 RepID=UPI003D0FD5CE